MGDRQMPPTAATMSSRCFQQLDEGYDEEYGGFAEAPKFPTPGQHPPAPSTRPGLLTLAWFMLQSLSVAFCSPVAW